MGSFFCFKSDNNDIENSESEGCLTNAGCSNVYEYSPLVSNKYNQIVIIACKFSIYPHIDFISNLNFPKRHT